MVFTARAILEVVGFPEDHVNTIRDKVLEKLSQEEGIKVVHTHVDPAAQLEGQKLFGSFIDVELTIETILRLYHFCLDYMPSSIEIVDQTEVFFELPEFITSLNDLLQRLHQFNIIISNLHNENKALKKKLGIQ